MLDAKNQLSITLTEPIVFLRSSDPSGRLQTEPNAAPTLVRGVLTLNVIKPIEISRIEVELVGLSTIISPATEGVGAYRADIPETKKLYSSSITVFRSDQLSRRSRPSSVGPGPSTSDSSDVHEQVGTAFSRPPSSLRRSERPSTHVIETGIPFDFGPTPPYTAVQSPITIESRFGVPEAHPNTTLDGLPRQARRYNSTDRFAPMSSHSDSVAMPFAPATHSSASSNTNISLDQENNDRSDEMPHTSPPHESEVSSHSNTDDPPRVLRHSASPSRRSSAHSPESTHPTRLRARGISRDDSNASAGQSRLRLSLNSVLGAVAEMAARSPSRSRSTAEETERGRTRDRMSREHQIRDRTLQTDEGVASSTNGHDNHGGTNITQPNTHTEHREHHFLSLSRFFGFEHDHEKDDRDSGREFKPGTYSYPISFLVPPHLPPTFSVPHGSMDYYIKGVAHRPGTFTSKLSCKIPLLVVAIGDGEDAGTGDLGPISIERQWEGRLAYSFELSSRLFLLGSQRHREATSTSIHSDPQAQADSEPGQRPEVTYGTVTLDLTLLPIEKVKIWKLSALVEQRIRYVDEGGKSLRGDDRRLVKLFEMSDECPIEEMDSVDDVELQAHKNKHKNKHVPVHIPLLPSPVSPHRSPLLRHIPPSSDPSILIGTGPYAVSFILGLPGCNGPSSSDSGLHFTMKQKSSGVRVEHTLKFIMRLERLGDSLDDTHDHEEKVTRKFFDLSLQAPITILSCRCDPEFQTLPSYSQTMEDDLLDHTTCPCQQSATSSTGEPEHQGEREYDELEDHPLQEQGHVHIASALPTPTSTSSSSSFNGGMNSDVASNSHSHFHHHHHHHHYHHHSSLDEHQWNNHSNPLTFTMSHSPPSPATWAHETSPSESAEPGPGPSTSGVYDDWHSQPQLRCYGHHRSSHSPSQSQSHAHACHHVHSHAHPHPSNHPPTPPVLTPHSSRPPSPLARYERLVSGRESEAGEAPPSYDSIATSGA